MTFLGRELAVTLSAYKKYNTYHQYKLTEASQEVIITEYSHVGHLKP